MYHLAQQPIINLSRCRMEEVMTEAMVNMPPLSSTRIMHHTLVQAIRNLREAIQTHNRVSLEILLFAIHRQD